MSELEWVSKTNANGDIVKWTLMERTQYRSRRIGEVVNVMTWWKVKLYWRDEEKHYFKSDEEAKAVAVALVRLK